MQEFTVDARSEGKSLIRVILAQYPHLNIAQVRKALRKKDIRQNGQRKKEDGPVAAGDVISVFLPDDWFAGRDPGDDKSDPYRIVYQDKMLLVLGKRPGVTVHQAGGSRDQGPFLIDQLRLDLKDPGLLLCHRLDRQTGGLLLIARNPAALGAVRDLMRQGLLLKRYQCLVRNVPSQGKPVRAVDGTVFMELTAWLEKDAGRSDVYIHDEKQAGDLPVTTRYRVLRVFEAAGPDRESVAELEVELVTGRTHQIRAHLAHLGHPLLGDGKYGRNSYNRFFRGARGSLIRQQLFATRLIFLPDVKGPLAYLAGRTFAVDADYDWTGAGQ